MCFEDVLFGRRCRAVSRQFAVTASSQRMLLHSPYRRAVIFGPSSGPDMWAQFEAAAVLGQGFYVSASGLPHIFLVDRFGDMVTNEWFVLGAVSGGTINLVEILLPEGPI